MTVTVAVTVTVAAVAAAEAEADPFGPGSIRRTRRCCAAPSPFFCCFFFFLFLLPAKPSLLIFSRSYRSSTCRCARCFTLQSGPNMGGHSDGWVYLCPRRLL